MSVSETVDRIYAYAARNNLTQDDVAWICKMIDDERERCALLAEDVFDDLRLWEGAAGGGRKIAEAIREAAK